MATPSAQPIARRGTGEAVSRPPRDLADWGEIEGRLLAGDGTCWLGVRSRHGVHTRPVFAAWTGSTFVLASSPDAAKTRHLEAGGPAGGVSLAIHLGDLHVVVEGTAARLTDAADLARASAALLEVYGWPTEVVGDLLDAPYAAPTSGGPPFQAWEIRPVKAIAQPTEDQVEPTRFRFP